MTQRHKAFTTPDTVQEPVTFNVSGKDITGAKWEEAFTAVPEIPGAKLLDFIADADSNDGGRAAQALVDFLEGVIVNDDRERFAELIRDESKVIAIETLAAICEWLVSEYAERPTESPKPQRVGRARSGRGSTATVSSKA